MYTFVYAAFCREWEESRVFPGSEVEGPLLGI